ncbi:ABC transporter substrate-binding protein [Enterococcus songbeiensis]
MKSWKKILGLVVMALSTTMFLTACGSKKEASDSDGKVTIRMSWWGNDDRHKATLAAIEKFEKANPSIKVKAEYAGWDGFQEKMTTQIAGGTSPDLMQINYDWYQSFSPNGDGFYDLNELKDEIDLSGYDEEGLDSGTIEGKLNGIAYGENTFLIGLNKSTFEKFDAEIPTTWEKYIEAAKKFDEGYYPIGRGGFSMIEIYLSQKTGKGILSNDGEIQFTKDELKEGFEWYQSLIDAGVLQSGKDEIETVGTAHPTTVKEFIDGKLAGATDWSGGVASYDAVLAETDQEFTIPNYPMIENAKTAGVIKKPSLLWSISKNTKYPKETAKLLDFLLNDPEGVKAMGTSRGVPSNQTAIDILEEDGQIAGIAADALKYNQETDGITESPYYEMAQVVEVYNTALQSFTLGQTDAEEAAQQTYDGIEAAIKEIKNQ